MTIGRFTTPKLISTVYPGMFTEYSIRAFISKSETNGFDRCLRRLGRRIFINLAEFEEWLDTHDKKKEKITELDKTEKVERVDKTPTCPHDAIIALYHEILPMCPPIKIWSERRRVNLRTRWRENEKHQTLDFWRNFFMWASQSKFLTGQSPPYNGRIFLADLEWLIRPTNFIKVVEGKYNRDF